jgi:hypothetical protein
MSTIELEWKRTKNEKTFWTRYEHYEYIVMSFELKMFSLSFKN